jgi:predicted nuclease of predicted toxin-antitoxin system
MARGGDRCAARARVKVLVDMNLSPDWVPLLRQHGFEAVHWSSIGPGNADDHDIMQWARDNGAVVFTHDLDFGITLALNRAGSPSVIQVRTQDVSPEHLRDPVVSLLNAHRDILASGALVTVDETRARIRILAIGEGKQNGG